MKHFHGLMTIHCKVGIKIRANSREEAEKIFEEWREKNPISLPPIGEYLDRTVTRDNKYHLSPEKLEAWYLKEIKPKVKVR